ncbi:uncharacterized protein DEA37_0001786 [Paragonimus westermani]|uniref:DNA-directed RNA polymerase III subunit RPC9 n=1 Tax=Paragonimus westermani TaxID=34504 RepID=A0A5J4NF77_9TREM|nr:uncharacterized protein DEA37_0001786 [Paragonimus westermani]
MEICCKSVKLLTNLEVLQLINSKLESKKKIRSQQTLLYTCSKYLKSKSPCGTQTADSISAFSKAVKSFKLSKMELAMLINHCPSTQVELSVLLPDVDSRFSTTEAEHLLELVAKHFPEGIAVSQTINSSGTATEGEDAR